MIRTVLLSFFVVLLSIGWAPAALAEDDPEQLILSLSDTVFDVLGEYRAGYADDPEPMQAELLTLLDPVVDFDSFSRGVMGSYYDSATPDQRTRFIKSFKDSIVDLYSDALAQSEIESMTAKETVMRSPSRANVVILVSSRVASSYTIQFSLRRADDGQWQVRNIIMNGVNIGLTFRNQFASAMDTTGGDLDEVIDDWPQIVKGQS